MDTFVVRLWIPADSAGDPRDARQGVHGAAHHVGSGSTATFRDGQELLDVLDTLRTAGLEPTVAVQGQAGPSDAQSTRS